MACIKNTLKNNNRIDILLNEGKYLLNYDGVLKNSSLLSLFDISCVCVCVSLLHIWLVCLYVTLLEGIQAVCIFDYYLEPIPLQKLQLADQLLTTLLIATSLLCHNS